MAAAAVVSLIAGSLCLAMDSPAWRKRKARCECEKLVQWLTNRYQQSIMKTESFRLTIPVLLSNRIWSNWFGRPWHEQETYYVKFCVLSKAGNYALMNYSPLYRTMSPGATVNIYLDKKACVYLGKIVIPVRGIPRLEWESDKRSGKRRVRR